MKKLLFIGFSIFAFVELEYVFKALIINDDFALRILPTSLAIVALYLTLLMFVLVRKLKSNL